MIHTGTSFADTAAAGYPAFRLRYGNPLLLENVLVRHPKLRLWIAHGGLPWTEETFALMQQYPRVYMDISTIDWIMGEQGRAGFYGFPPFLTPEQKADIFYNNAATFFRVK